MTQKVAQEESGFLVDVNRDKLFSLEDLADLFQVSLSTIKAMKKSGPFPWCIKPATKELYPAGAVNEFIQDKHPELLEKTNALHMAKMALVKAGDQS